MKVKIAATILITLALQSISPCKATATLDTVFAPQCILAKMHEVADWQLRTWNEVGFKHPKADWINAVGYTGLYAAGTLTGGDKYLKELVAIGDELKWNTGRYRFYADDYCIAQTYALLYIKYHREQMIAPFILQADSIISQPHTEPLSWKNNIQNREWAWCDALFMGPPALAYLTKATGNLKYLDKAAKLWWKTTDFLYSSKDSLYFRDETYFQKKEKNGAPVFWSRGNGWVLGGLVRMMECMPANYPEKEKFEKLYKGMAAKIASLQQPDGSWHASLLNPENFPVREMSGTAFYCYALAWGLNQGLLNEKIYLPVVQRSWRALTSAIMPDGKLGYVQPVGASPDKVDANSTEVYGVGAFLLAGNELYQYMQKHNKAWK